MTTPHSFFLLSLCSGSLLTANAATTLVSPSVYNIDESIIFRITNSGASDYLFTWSEIIATGFGGFEDETYREIEDPTLILTIGQTYIFERFSTSHPLAITSTAMSVSGTDGSFARTSSTGTAVSPFILSPIADFTANPSSASDTPSGDPIIWTPTASEIGDYWYTCTVTSHTGMTGKIIVIPEPSTAALSLLGMLFLIRRKR